MAGTYSAYERSYNTFSGVDIIATFGGRHIGELQGISFTSTREIAPLYTMGSKNPRAFAKGKRGIAGSLIFLTFDREGLLETVKGMDHMQFVAKTHEIRQNQIPGSRNVRTGNLAEYQIGIDGGSGTTSPVSNVDNRLHEFANIEYQLVSPMYYDEIPPFSVVLNAVNEAGHTMRLILKGVQIMNAGSGTSIDDITIDTTCTFVATELIPWHNQGFIDAQGIWHSASEREYHDLWGGSRD
jgi:hypothetical protein